MCEAGMTDDERLMLEEMKRREQKLKLELDEQESEMRAQQQLLHEQEAERNRLAAEFEAMQQQVKTYPNASHSAPFCRLRTGDCQLLMLDECMGIKLAWILAFMD